MPYIKLGASVPKEQRARFELRGLEQQELELGAALRERHGASSRHNERPG